VRVRVVKCVRAGVECIHVGVEGGGISVHEGLESARTVEGGGVEGECKSIEFSNYQ
jgi:hypothetical protein